MIYVICHAALTYLCVSVCDHMCVRACVCVCVCVSGCSLNNAKQKHLGCEKVQGQSETTLQAGRHSQKV